MNSEPVRKDTARLDVKKLAGLALFAAIVVVLQLIGSFIKFGPFSISLVLIPIVVGAAVYGAGAGAFLGFVFGVVVLISCINGTDPGGYILWSSKPFFTALTVLVKGVAAGAAAGLAFKALERVNTYLGVVAAAIVCPVVNTGLFLAAMFLFFKDALTEWAGGKPLVYFAIVIMVGANFLFELAANVLFSPICHLGFREPMYT